MKNRILSSLIVLTLLISLVPVFPAFAADEELIKISEGQSYAVNYTSIKADTGDGQASVGFEGLLNSSGYGQGNNYKHRRQTVLRFDLTDSVNEILAADGIQFSIGVNDNFDSDSTNDGVNFQYLKMQDNGATIRVAEIHNLNDSWGPINGNTKNYKPVMLASGTDFDITEITTFDYNDIEICEANVSYATNKGSAIHQWGTRLITPADDPFSAFVLDKIENEEYVFDILIEIKDIPNAPDTYFGFYLFGDGGNTNTYRGGKAYLERFQPAVRWYQKKKSEINTLESVEIDNGFLTEEFDKEVNDYTIAVLDEDTEVEIFFEKTSKLSKVENEVTFGSVGDTLTIPVTSEAGITRTYTFNLVKAEDLGFTEDGKIEITDISYESETFTKGETVKINATMKNNSTSEKTVARVTRFVKDGKINDEYIKYYYDVTPGFQPAISAGLNGGQADFVSTYFADISDMDDMLAILRPVGDVITARSVAKPSIAKREAEIDYYYKNIESPKVTVSGKWTGENKNLTVYIIDENTDINDYDYEMYDVDEFFTFIDAVKADANGYYGFDGYIPTTGNYKIGIIDGNGVNKELPFYFASPTDKDNALKDLDRATSEEDLKGKLLLTLTEEERDAKVNLEEVDYNYVKLLAIPTDEIGETVTEDGFIKVLYDMIVKSDDYSEFLKLYDNALLLTKINEGKILDISTYTLTFGLPYDIVEIYADLPKEQREDLSQVKMAGKDITEVSKVKEVFKEETLLKAVSYAPGLESLRDYIVTYAEDLSVDDYITKFTKLNSVKEGNILEKVVEKAPYLTVEAFEKVFEKEVKAYKEESQGGGGGSSPSAGANGGSGSSSSMNVTGSLTPSTNITTEQIEGSKGHKFTDLAGYDWAQDAITALYNKKVINGISEEAFNPAGEVKREEFVKMIAVLYEGQTVNTTFKDLDLSAWYIPYINKAVASGIIKGIDGENFGIGNGVTRQDMAVIIYRAIKGAPAQSDKFADDDAIAEYAKEAVYFLKSKGIVSGTGEGFEPSRVMTRAEAAVVINNTLKMLNK